MNYPAEAYPITKVITFKCSRCFKILQVSEHFMDNKAIGDGDSLNFHCECGAYYKKVSKIREHLCRIDKEVVFDWTGNILEILIGEAND